MSGGKSSSQSDWRWVEIGKEGILSHPGRKASQPLRWMVSQCSERCIAVWCVDKSVGIPIPVTCRISTSTARHPQWAPMWMKLGAWLWEERKSPYQEIRGSRRRRSHGWAEKWQWPEFSFLTKLLRYHSKVSVSSIARFWLYKYRRYRNRYCIRKLSPILSPIPKKYRRYCRYRYFIAILTTLVRSGIF
jgi:hypothetical protein